MTGVTGLNHAVLYVRDLERSLAFYAEVLGLEIVERKGDAAAFLHAPASRTHHDLGLFAVGSGAGAAGPRSVGLYHLAWEVADIRDLAVMAGRLREREALVGMSDHGVSKSLYARDPDGIEFEVMWLTPRESWGEAAHDQPVDPLDLDREVERWTA